MPHDAPSLAMLLTEVGAFRDEPFTLIDVGCSGGLYEPAHDFMPDLRAVGFDPLISEVDRLNRENSSNDVRFEAALVGEDDWVQQPNRVSPGVVARSSAARFAEIHDHDHVRAYYNAGQNIETTNESVRLDTWLAGHPGWTIDWIKTDTDGNDLTVLRSLGRRITEPLAVSLEAQFDMDAGPDHDSFANVFNLLVANGFRLFDLRPTRYSKSAMPQAFEWEMPAQTTRGQILQADALFCRDLAVEGTGSPGRILKLACIFDQMGLQDCAAELLETHSDVMSTTCPLDSLAIEQVLACRTPLGMTPAESRKALEADPSVFFPTRADNGDLIPAGSNAEGGRPPAPAISPGGAPLEIGTAEGRSTSALGAGWSEAEELGAWTSRPHATLWLDIPEAAAGCILEMHYWRLGADETAQTFAVSVNGQMLAEAEGAPDGVARFVMPDQLPPSPSEITIYAWPLLKPADVLGSDDERTLGVWLSGVRLAHPGEGDDPNA